MLHYKMFFTLVIFGELESSRINIWVIYLVSINIGLQRVQRTLSSSFLYSLQAYDDWVVVHFLRTLAAVAFPKNITSQPFF